MKWLLRGIQSLIYTLDARLSLCTHMLLLAYQLQCRCRKHLFKSIWDLRASEQLDYANELCGYCIVFVNLKTSPRLFQLFW